MIVRQQFYSNGLHSWGPILYSNDVAVCRIQELRQELDKSSLYRHYLKLKSLCHVYREEGGGYLFYHVVDAH